MTPERESTAEQTNLILECFLSLMDVAESWENVMGGSLV